jgi:hypothetical protein
MTTLRRLLAAGFVGVSALSVSASGCGGSSNGSGFGPPGPAPGDDAGGMFGDDASGQFGDDGGSGFTGPGGQPAQCPPGLQCNVSCSGGATTSISGKVYDPAKKNPLYNVAVYVPGAPLQALPKGVPTGADACSCAALFKSGGVVSAATGVDGSFKLTNAPVGAGVPLVLQVGKWRRLVHVNTKQCQDNPQPDTSLALPATVAAGDINDNIPDIAVSTGRADTLECLMKRIGLPESEYVAGAGGSGHIHVFAGGDPGGGGGAGRPENPGMTGAPESSTSLWDSQAHLMPYDITLLSCEGGETYNANPDALEQYLNAGGRVFSSHFHYAWFSGPIDSTGTNMYTAPPDWGNNLANWTPGGGGMGNTTNGAIVQTLNVGGGPFPKGVALYQWLGLVNALGVNGAPPQLLPIVQPRFNAVVAASNKPSQPWIVDSQTMSTMYFSFDTPVNAPPGPKGGPPNYCGRVVFSDLHVGGGSMDSQNPPSGCAQADLSPQEKALEFMLFDLSSCVIPDTVPPSMGGVPK